MCYNRGTERYDDDEERDMSKRARRPATTAVHSVRCTEETWQAARRRADFEGVTMNYVLSEFLEGYGKGLLNLPKVLKKYEQPS